MRSTLLRYTTALACALVLGMVARAQTQTATILTNELQPYLQAEINEVAMLNGQATLLQQSGDALGAALIASYVPDHQMQISRITGVIQANGGVVPTMQPTITVPQGTRDVYIAQELTMHHDAINNYNRLARNTTLPVVRTLANLGIAAATTHWNSLMVAQAATLKTPSALNAGVQASLALERTAVADLQAQAAQLTALGDMAGANTLNMAAQAHQQQAANWTQIANTLNLPTNNLAVPAPVTLATRGEILGHERVFNTQLINTYALQIASLPPGPLLSAASGSQQVALLSLTQIGTLPVA